jgi:hypothetical protein
MVERKPGEAQRSRGTRHGNRASRRVNQGAPEEQGPRRQVAAQAKQEQARRGTEPRPKRGGSKHPKDEGGHRGPAQRTGAEAHPLRRPSGLRRAEPGAKPRREQSERKRKKAQGHGPSRAGASTKRERGTEAQRGMRRGLRPLQHELRPRSGARARRRPRSFKVKHKQGGSQRAALLFYIKGGAPMVKLVRRVDEGCLCIPP